MSKIPNRSCLWATIIYPDSVPANWISKLSDLHISCAISPLHDKDVNADNTPKKPHYHVLFDFDRCLKSYDQMQYIVNLIGGVGCERVSSKRAYARYLCHLDNYDKAQYSIDSVRCLGGFDYINLIQSPSSKYHTLNDIIEWCDINHVVSYSDLVDYCRVNNYTWWCQLCDGGTLLIKEYMKSKVWKYKIENIKKS